MADSVTNSPARSLGEPASLTDSDPEGDSTGADSVAEPPAPQQTLVDGWLKFRDARRWKQRWGVVTKLSPAADCLHLQLYRDSKDRYKQGQTKASLSLQHFLGIETGFTLDKESNTIAIICQDVTVILAFDTRERLIQWQVKISNNLGDDQQFLVQITSAPPKTKLATGPARLHIMDQRFCITTGVPPRLVGYWEIAHLRRYGVVEGRFCFEGGSRCGRGEGLHVCACDRAEEVAATVRLAADGRLALRRRPLARKLSALESPRRQPRPDTRASDISCAAALLLGAEAPQDACLEDLLCPCRLQAGGGSPFWSSAESAAGQLTELDCNYGCGDTTSVRDMRRPPSSLAGEAWACEGARGGGGAAGGPPGLERCASCISKLGAPALSRSSTATAPDTPSAQTPFSPAWTMDGGPSAQVGGVCVCGGAAGGGGGGGRAPSSCGRASVASLSSGSGSGSGSGTASEYCVPRLCAQPDLWYDRPRPVSSTGGPPHVSPHSPPSVPPKSPKPGATPAASAAAPCPCCPPTRPPKPPQMGGGGPSESPSKKKPRKPPMPLPLSSSAPAAPTGPSSASTPVQAPPPCHCPHHPGVVLQQPLQRHDVCPAAGPYDNYDVPKPLAGTQTYFKEQAREDSKQLERMLANQQGDYYDTPKKIKDSLSTSMNDSMFGNYDTPPVVKTVRKPCGCVIKYTTKKSVMSSSQIDSTKSEHEESGASAATHCPCQRVMYWAENWMMLPYCRRGNGMENTGVPIHKVKLSGEGKMPVVNASGEIAIYATVDKNKKTNRRLALSESDSCSCPPEARENPSHVHTCPKPDTSNYVNVETAPGVSSPSGTNQDSGDSNLEVSQTNYENIDFAQSLEYYENARDVLQRAGVTQQEAEALACELDEGKGEMEESLYAQGTGFKFCNKCGHACHIPRTATLQQLSGAATPDGNPDLPSGAAASAESNPGPAAATIESSDAPGNRQDDYLMMEPSKHLQNQSNKNFPGYLPMSPITNPNAGYNKLRIDQGLPAEKSASIPSLTAPMVDRSRKRSESEFPRVPGSAMMMMHHSANSPYLRRLLMDTADDTRRTQLLTRKRSSSADSSRYLDGSCEQFESEIMERPLSSSQTKLLNPQPSRKLSVTLGEGSAPQSEQEAEQQKVVIAPSSTEAKVATASAAPTVVEAVTAPSGPAMVAPPVPTEVPSASPSPSVVATVAKAPVAVAEETDSGSASSGSPRSVAREVSAPGTALPALATAPPNETLSPSAVHIRRSSSVPCKGNNRDSSSSNDSGVSTGSLRQRGADFAEFELPLTTATSARRHQHALAARHPGALCLHASLPRRSKSVDPLRELSFQFQKIKVPAKSSSAEAEVPICPAKRDGTKGFQSPGGEGAAVVAYMDSRSTSSGTSDMSDYIETLSLSSHSSSDTPDSLRLGRPATTTLRPRSGKEYQLIDRSILEGDLKPHLSGPIGEKGHHLRGLVPPYPNFTPLPEKAESPSPGYMSASPGQEREDQPLIAHGYPK